MHRCILKIAALSNTKLVRHLFTCLSSFLPHRAAWLSQFFVYSSLLELTAYNRTGESVMCARYSNNKKIRATDKCMSITIMPGSVTSLPACKRLSFILKWFEGFALSFWTFFWLYVALLSIFIRFGMST